MHLEDHALQHNGIPDPLKGPLMLYILTWSVQCWSKYAFQHFSCKRAGKAPDQLSGAIKKTCCFAKFCIIANMDFLKIKL